MSAPRLLVDVEHVPGLGYFGETPRGAGVAPVLLFNESAHEMAARLARMGLEPR
jgi:hypothetical protein